MGSYNNPDFRVNSGLSQGQLELARFIEEAALIYIKELLTRMGVPGITQEDTMQDLAAKMTPYKISVVHTLGGEQDGWWFKRDGKAEIHMEHPSDPDRYGRINFRTRFMM